jgi:hypothetical protein
MQLPNTGNQTGAANLFAVDSTITTGGTSQRILSRSISRSYLFIQNISTGPLFVEIGDARATATLTLGAVSSLTVTNGGFGYTRVPQVFLFGGGYATPAHPAAVHAVLAGGIVTSFVIDDPGVAYGTAPGVFIVGDFLDPHGVADPYFSSSNSGFRLGPNGGNLEWNGTVCPTAPVSIWGATTGQAFTLRWMT